jgi:hypothetical protein
VSDQFLYLLGAGASCKILPLASQLPDALERYYQKLSDWGKKVGASNPDMMTSLRWLIDQGRNHATIDTFAKKLYFRRKEQDLLKLKSLLSCYFVYEQGMHPVDFRYDSFLASVLTQESHKPPILPSNVRIITWNYDSQLDKAFYGFSDDTNWVIRHITLGNQVHRINGCCGTLQPGHIGGEFVQVFDTGNLDVLNKTIGLYEKYINSTEGASPDINFAWEFPLEVVQRQVEPVIRRSTILIIIGYSFPFFNREIDRMILQSLGDLRKVYLQLPASAQDAVSERINALVPKYPKIERIYDENAFHIPNEF